MLHRVDNYSSNTIVVAFNEVKAFLGAFGQVNMPATIKKVDPRYVSMIGTLEAYDEWLVIA